MRTCAVALHRRGKDPAEQLPRSPNFKFGVLLSSAGTVQGKSEEEEDSGEEQILLAS